MLGMDVNVQALSIVSPSPSFRTMEIVTSCGHHVGISRDARMGFSGAMIRVHEERLDA